MLNLVANLVDSQLNRVAAERNEKQSCSRIERETKLQLMEWKMKLQLTERKMGNGVAANGTENRVATERNGKWSCS